MSFRGLGRRDMLAGLMYNSGDLRGRVLVRFMWICSSPRLTGEPTVGLGEWGSTALPPKSI